MFEQLLEQNQDIRSRLDYLGNIFSATIPSERHIEENLSTFSAVRRKSSTAYSVKEMLVLDNVVSDGAIFSIGQRRAFEEILENTRVYRRTQHNSADASFRSSVVRTHAWSVLSELSLADISVQSVIALPLFPEDNVNLQWYILARDDSNQRTHPSLYERITDNIIVAGAADELIGLAISTADNDRIELSSRMALPRAQPSLPPPRHGTTSTDFVSYKIAVFGDGGAGKSQLTLRVGSVLSIALLQLTCDSFAQAIFLRDTILPLRIFIERKASLMASFVHSISLIQLVQKNIVL